MRSLTYFYKPGYHRTTSLSHTHLDTHTHTHTHTHMDTKLPARNLFELSTLESEGDRTGPPHQSQTARAMRQAMVVSL